MMEVTSAAGMGQFQVPGQIGGHRAVLRPCHGSSEQGMVLLQACQEQRD